MSLRPFLTFKVNSKIFKVQTCIKMRKKSAELQELGRLAKDLHPPSTLVPQASLEILTKQKLEQVPCSKVKAGSVQPSFATIVARYCILFTATLVLRATEKSIYFN